MPGATTISSLAIGNRRIHVDPAAAGIWVLAFALPAYLALKGGGYDGIVRGQIGVVVWWAILVGAVVGILPVARPTRAAWAMLGLLGAFTLWTMLSTTWSSSSERSVLEAAREATHLGVLALAVFALRRDTARHAVNALAAAVGLIAVLALLSRLHPSWFPTPAATTFLPSVASRLSYPLNYWNGLGAFMALGIPPLLCAASSGRTLLARAVTGAAVPLCFTALYLTYSRGAILARGRALVGLVVAWPRRIGLLASMVVAAAGSAILAFSIAQRHELANGQLTDLATRQGSQVIWIACFVAIGCGLLQCAVALVDRHVERPRALSVTPRRLTAIFVGAVVLIGIVAVMAGGLGQLSDHWQSFKRHDSGSGVQGDTAQRLTASSGNGRYQYWVVAAHAADAHPVNGVGAGTFEYWWAQHATIGGFIRNAHSLWMESLAELGYVGLAIIVALFAVPLGVGALRMRRLADLDRVYAAAALAGLAGFCVSATFDWVWQITVLPVAALLLAAVLLVPARAARAPARSFGWRVPVVVLSAAAMVLIALPLAGLVSVSESQADVNGNNLVSALRQANTAHRVQPYAATPQLQQALLLEQTGDLDAAAVAATRATEAERKNWRTWLVLSRIQAERGHAAASVATYRQAKSLNPRSPLFR